MKIDLTKATQAAKQVLLEEDCLSVNRDGNEHYVGYHDAVTASALEAALPHIRAEIAKQVRAAMPPLSARRSGQTMRACMEHVAQLIEGTTP